MTASFNARNAVAVLVVAGLLWPWLKRMHLFHLPGDIVIDRPGLKFFFPITTTMNRIRANS